MKLTTTLPGALALALTLAAPAVALDPREAEAVVAIMEQLGVESGEGMYHGGGDIAYAFDGNGFGLIPAAGFSEQSWIVAYDAVATGYMATIPQDEFDAILNEPLAMLEASTLSDELKAEMLTDMEQLIAEAQAARETGFAHADVVRPLAARLDVLFSGEFGE